MFRHEEFQVKPRRGELIVYDKLARRLVNHVLLPVPTATTKGVLVSPAIYGNVLLGPTAEDLNDKSATNTSENGLKSLLEKGRKILPRLLEEEVTATYAGLRAATEHSDYQIQLHAEQRYICVGGIRSKGISGCLGSAEYVDDLLKEAGVELKRKKFLSGLSELSGSRNADVLIVGARPAGLAAALELKKLGINDIDSAERGSEAGGIPRLCGHTGFGLRDFRRVMTGPSYAQKYRGLIEDANIDLRVANFISNINLEKSNNKL